MYPAPENIIALSTVCVGVGPGGTTSMLAYASLISAFCELTVNVGGSSVVVNFHGEPLLDKFVLPTMQVVDYREATTGIKSWQLFSKEAMPFNVLQQYIATVIRGKIVVGHGIWNDLSGKSRCTRSLPHKCDGFTVLGIPHPAAATRDVALYQPFRNALRSPHQVIGLQTLCWQLMRRRCQEGLIDPSENARAAMDLYRSDSKNWEATIAKGNWPSCLPPSTFSRCYS
ncbi:hypothetical protein MSAN_02167700 [Mycena sanguinolenta]|uniref:RNA exonuclease 4 n=1 Tax=Mycena sanguinolenta TaxID=230812 RepID=A0A8H6XFE5_9AGAR|nr:hypothetical protein MSAN_02167700 [Mycena sanguinolenta]